MKFNVSSKTLYNAVSSVGRVIQSKNAITILNSFYIEVGKDQIILRGSDVENALTARIPVTNAKGEGAFCVEAKRFTDMLKELPEQGIEFNIDDNYAVSVKYAGGVYDFAAYPGEQYPMYQLDENDNGEPQEFTVTGSQLTRAIENTLFAVDTKDFHPITTGILFEVHPDGITYVATDTRKLVKFVDRSSAPGVTASRVVPAKPASILRNIFDAEQTVKVSFTAKSATFASEDIELNCRFIMGNYPAYNNVIPRSNNLLLTVDRMTFLNAVKRVSVFVDPNSSLLKLLITPDSIAIKSEDNNLMTCAKETIAASFTGERLLIGFSSQFLPEVLNAVKTPDISIMLSDPARPGIVRPAEDEPDTELLILLMPMNVSEF